MSNSEFESEIFFNWIDDMQFRTKLSLLVRNAKDKRTESQEELSKWINVSQTKIKQIENGTCVDFNAINNYLNYFGKPLFDDKITF